MSGSLNLNPKAKEFHPVSAKEKNVVVLTGNESVPEIASENNNSVKINRKCIVYFKSGSCRYGEKCKFKHVIDAKGSKLDEKSNSAGSGLSTTRKRLDVLNVSNLKQMNKSEIDKLRQTEIEQLKKSFRASIRILTLNNENLNFEKAAPSVSDVKNSFHCEVVFKPSDPDWPYTADSFPCSIYIPGDYPFGLCTVSLLDHEEIPKRVVSWINRKLKEKLEGLRNSSVVLVVRPFFRWLHREFESLFTQGGEVWRQEQTLKKHGIELVPYSAIEVCGQNESEDVFDNSQSANSCLLGEEKSTTSEGGAEGQSCAEEEQKVRPLPIRGTELYFKDVTLRNVGVLKIRQLHLTISCQRCRVRKDVVLQNSGEVSVQCKKCRNGMFARFSPVMVHETAFIAGHIEAMNCMPFDVITHETIMTASCLECSRDSTINGIQRMVAKELSCIGCHTKLTLQIDAVGFRQNQSIVDENTKFKPLNVANTKKAKDTEYLVIGEPLPGRGTCKHYKKSHRWFRFPCCGKLFPCDKCHILNSAKDHEVKIANRMVCGFCSREQVFSDKIPCQCGAALGPQDKTAFWEGGKGCRDQTKMSKGDAKKYTGKNKVASKKSERVGSKAKK